MGYFPQFSIVSHHNTPLHSTPRRNKDAKKKLFAAILLFAVSKLLGSVFCAGRRRRRRLERTLPSARPGSDTGQREDRAVWGAASVLTWRGVKN